MQIVRRYRAQFRNSPPRPDYSLDILVGFMPNRDSSLYRVPNTNGAAYSSPIHRDKRRLIGPEQHFKQLYRRGSIARCPVPILYLDSKALANISEAVRTVPRKNFPAQPYGTELVTVEVLIQPLKLFSDKIVVETHIVRHKPGVLCQLTHRIGNFLEGRSILYHPIIDAREPCNERWDVSLWVDQRVKGVHHLMPIVAENGDFSNTGWAFYSARSFNINDCVQIRLCAMNYKM